MAASGVLLWWVRRAGRAAMVGEGLLGLGLGALALALRLHAPVPEFEAGPVPLTLLTPPVPRGGGCQVEVYVHGRREGAALLQAPDSSCGWLPGQRALGRIRLSPVRPATNPGQWSSRRRWARRGIHRVARIQEELLFAVGSPPRGPAALLERLRRALGRSIDPPGVESHAGGLLRALVVGDRTRLTEETRAVFQRSGTAHLLAVSGLHVGWIFVLTHVCLGFVVRRVPSLALLRRARAISLSVGAAAACGYAVLSGLAVPALRAAAMASAGTLALLGGRPAAAWNALALAALVVLAWDPGSLFEPSFALSFSAVAGILVWGGGGGRLTSLLHATLAAGLATAPLVAAIDAPLAALGPVANLLAVPLFGAIVLPLGLLSACLGALSAGAADMLGPLARGVAEFGIRVVEGLGSASLLEGSEQPVRRALLLAAAGFVLRLSLLRRWRAALCAGALATGALLFPAQEPAPGRAGDSASVLFLDVGHGDAVLVRSGSRAWLVDAGPSFGRFDAGRSIVRPALRAEGVRALEVLLLSHADRDHIGGARAILEAVPVRELWVTRPAWESVALERIRRVAARRGIPIRLAAAGERATLGALALSVLWPPPGFSSRRTNESSLVLRVEGPHGCALLPGDVPSAVELELARELGPCELLKLAHHGSDSSTDTLWLRQLRPWVAIASAGRRPRSPLPHALVRERLRADSVTLYETRRYGALRIRFTPAGLVVDPFFSAPGSAETR